MVDSRRHNAPSVAVSAGSTSSSIANIRRCSWWSLRISSVMSTRSSSRGPGVEGDGDRGGEVVAGDPVPDRDGDEPVGVGAETRGQPAAFRAEGEDRAVRDGGPT